MKVFFNHEIKPTDKLSSKELVNLILSHRQIKNVKEFLDPPSPLLISLTDFDKTYRLRLIEVMKLLKEIKEKNQMIIIYTDYDADGITGGAILWETLYRLGFKVMPYVPNRKTEGYGFSIQGIDNVIKKYYPTLVISVDHGITKIKEIEYAKKKGLKIIITDHHLKAKKIPKAEAIFHIPELSGSGVAYFFAKEIFTQFSHPKGVQARPILDTLRVTRNFETDYLVLASIGTIADLVPLVGPSRSIVKYGLEAFSKTKRFGIRHILKEAAIEGKKITPYEVGFIIAPRINAVGRLEHAIDALRLLCTTNEKKAYELAHKVGKTNIERQDLVQKSVEEARLSLRANPAQRRKRNNLNKEIASSPKLIILVSDKWHEGIIGLIASKIAEEYYRSTIVLTKTDDHYKGSARSIPSFHILNFLRSLKKYLIDVGGHSQAAGFTIEKNQLNNFVTAAQELSLKLIKDKDLERKIDVDIKIPVSKINLEMVKALESLEPYGVGNPRPIFLSEGEITNIQTFGKDNRHLKLFIENLEFIAFNQAEKLRDLSRGQKIKSVYTLEVDRWGGRERLRGKLSFLC